MAKLFSEKQKPSRNLDYVAWVLIFITKKKMREVLVNKVKLIYRKEKGSNSQFVTVNEF